MATPISILSGGTRGFELGIFKNGSVAQGFNFPLSSNYRWWNGVDVLATQYLIYTDKYTMGSSTLSETIPVAWATPDLTDQSLINLINTLPPRVGQPSFTSLQPALDWLQGTNNFYLIKNGLENIVTTNLQLYYDAGLYTSYVGTGTLVNDLTTNNFDGTLLNSVGFNSSGVAAFSFDGTDDAITGGDVCEVTTGSFSIEVWVKINVLGTFQVIVQKGNPGIGSNPGYRVRVSDVGIIEFVITSVSGEETQINSSSALVSGKWYLVHCSRNGTNMKIFVDGVLSTNGSGTSGSLDSGSSQFYVGRQDGGNWPLNGMVSSVKFYDTQLTPQQVLQNYNTQKGRFGLPTNVTNGLVAQLEAGNPSSYPGSGTIWYDISGNNNNFTLFNGASYDSTTKSMVFDGSDDYARSTNFINLSSASGVTVQTISKQDNTNVYMLWEHTPDWNSNSGGFGSAVNANGNSTSVNEFHANWNNQAARNFVNTAPSSSTFFSHTHRLIKNNQLGLQDWINTDLQTFVGPSYPTGTSTLGNNNGFANNYTYLASRGGSAVLLDGNIGVFLMYNRPLSQPEIVQNYEYYRSIYGLSGVTKNGLVLWYDAGNNQSYPSQGKTWYDISGSMFDGRLLNGPTYSTDGGGSIVFDGADDYVSSIGTTSTFSFIQNTGIYTISAWVKPAVLGTAMYFAGNNSGTGGEKGFYFGKEANNNCWLALTNGSGTILDHRVSNFFLNTTDWVHVTCVGNSTTNQFYKNGIAFSNAGSITSLATGTSSQTLALGSINNVLAYNYWWNGSIANFQIYNRALTASEVLQNFNAQKSRFGL